MIDDDHLSNEVAISATATESGLEGKAKSRAISGIDRLLGNLSELLNAPMEDWISKRRSRIEARREVVKAATGTMVREIESNPEIAERVLEGTFDRAIRRQENVASVTDEAIEKLRAFPPTEEESEAGSEEMSEEFLTTFERYAEDASTEDLRTKWANVFAAEVKRPGTFGRRAMRIIDEISSDTAEMFARMSAHRIGQHVPQYLYKPDFAEMSTYIEYGLCQSSYPGIMTLPMESTFNDGIRRFLFFASAKVGVGLQADGSKERFMNSENRDLIRWNDQTNSPGIPLVPITNSGQSLLKIMDDKSLDNARRLYLELKKIDPTAILFVAEQNPSNIENSIIRVLEA